MAKNHFIFNNIYLRFIPSDISIDTKKSLWLVLAWYIYIFPSFSFGLFVSLWSISPIDSVFEQIGLMNALGMELVHM